MVGGSINGGSQNGILTAHEAFYLQTRFFGRAEVFGNGLHQPVVAVKFKKIGYFQTELLISFGCKDTCFLRAVTGKRSTGPLGFSDGVHSVFRRNTYESKICG